MNWKFWQRSLENPKTPLAEAFAATPSATGISVSPQNALETTSVMAAARTISSTIATLPLPVFRHVDAGKERVRDHACYTLLHDRPNPEMSSFVWRELLMMHVLLFGNHYSEVERNARGDVIALWPIHPTNVLIHRNNGRRVYVVRADGRGDVVLDSDSVIHIQGFSLDGMMGLMPIYLARNALGLAKALEEHGAKYFRYSATPSGLLTHPGRLGEEAAQSLRASWQRMYGGSAQRVGILEEGMQFVPLSLNNEVSQFLESRKFSVSEVARIFQIPAHMIGDLERATFSNIEQMAIQYVTQCIEPWTRRIEQELNWKLFNDASHFCEFQLQGLLRGDAASRASYYRTMANIGALTPNEIRAMENLNSIEGGDVPRVPLNMAPLNDMKEAA